MQTYLRDAGGADLKTDSRGCYIGLGNLWLETSSNTVAFRSDMLKSINSIVKVPAREFSSLMDHGVRNISLRKDNVVVATDHFQALLPSIPAMEYSADIKVQDHIELPQNIVERLLTHLSSAIKVVNTDATNPIYRLIFIAESRLFATDGYSLFVGRLGEALKSQMVLDVRGGIELVKLWGKQLPKTAMYSSRSLLCKSTGLTTETRCVDSSIPAAIYRTARAVSAGHCIGSVLVSQLKDSLICIGIQSDLRGTLHIATQEGRLNLTTDNGTAQLELLTNSQEDEFECSVHIGALLSAIEILGGESITIMQSTSSKKILTLFDRFSESSVTIATKESR